jgi:Short C-terminal domain
MIADELHKLFELLQKGAITQEEYLAQKNKLLGN